MGKAGMTREGFRPHHCKKDGVYIDVFLYGITREAFERKVPNPMTASDETTDRTGSAIGWPPSSEIIAASNISSLERTLVMRHFSGKTADTIGAELRVYGKSLATDYGRLSGVALAYYLPAARSYLESEDAEGDWDFAHGLVQSLAAKLGGDVLCSSTREAAVDIVRYVRENAARYQIETDKQPSAGWVKAVLG